MFLLPRPLAVLLAAFVLVFTAASTARADVNITLEDTASQILYSPPACGLSSSSGGSDSCSSSWCVQIPITSSSTPLALIALLAPPLRLHLFRQVVASPNASDGTITVTSGATDASGAFIPQLFLSVRGECAIVLHGPHTAAHLTARAQPSPCRSRRPRAPPRS